MTRHRHHTLTKTVPVSKILIKGVKRKENGSLRSGGGFAKKINSYQKEFCFFLEEEKAFANGRSDSRKGTEADQGVNIRQMGPALLERLLLSSHKK